jgi:hypothetical protein
VLLLLAYDGLGSPGTFLRHHDTRMRGSMQDADEFAAMATLVNTPEPVFPGNFQNALEGFDKYACVQCGCHLVDSLPLATVFPAPSLP